ncbi:MAG: KH domain-containing protein [Coriobacteriia bacterium]|nr:KH domain-containing protein [Coriobacteriia bacterium]
MEHEEHTDHEERSPVELVTFLVTSLVDNPDEIVVEAEEGPDGMLVRVNAHPDDVGKIIGRGGRTIKSIRTLVRAVAGRSYHVSVEG